MKWIKHWLVRSWKATSKLLDAHATKVYWVIVLCILIGGGWLAYSAPSTLQPIPPDTWPRFARITKIVELMLIALGATSLFVMWRQMVISSRWNQHLSYHQFFSELGPAQKRENLYRHLRRLGIPVPKYEEPMSPENARKILDDRGAPSEEFSSARKYLRALVESCADSKIPTPAKAPADLLTFLSDPEVGETAASALASYLDDFEEFAAAVRSSVLDREYAMGIEGARIISTFFRYQTAIDGMQREARRKQEEAAARGVVTPFIVSGYYELRRLATEWLEIRAADELRRKKKEGGDRYEPQTTVKPRNFR